jgi:transcriptional regulator with XRE-family HTH domain
MADYKQILAENVKQTRKGLKLSQEALAYEANIDRTYVSGIERAKRLKTTPAALLTPAKE